MADFANLTVRSVHNHGENHNWDEVLIEGKWVIVDPSMHLFNPSPSFYDKNRTINGKVVNLSYAFALYPNGSIEDITARYTNISYLTVFTYNENMNPIPNVSVFVLSNNYMKNWNTGVNCTTDVEGKCKISLGDGDYTILALSQDFIPLTNETSIRLEENKNTTIRMILKPDPARILLSSYLHTFQLIIYPIILWIAIVLYVDFVKSSKR